MTAATAGVTAATAAVTATAASVTAATALSQNRLGREQESRQRHANNAERTVPLLSHDQFSQGAFCDGLLGLSQAGVLETVYLLYSQGSSGVKRNHFLGEKTKLLRSRAGC